MTSSFRPALSAVDRPTWVRFEGNFTFLTAISTNCLVHLFLSHLLFQLLYYLLCKNCFLHDAVLHGIVPYNNCLIIIHKTIIAMDKKSLVLFDSLGVYHFPDSIFHFFTMFHSIIDSRHFGCKRKRHLLNEFVKQRVGDSLF